MTIAEHFIDWLPFIASLLVVLGGWYFGRQERNTNIAAKIVEATDKLIGPLNQRIDELEKKVTALSSGIHILITQIRRLGYEPEWTPDDMQQPKRKAE